MVINHTGYFDFAYAGLAAQKSGRLVRFMAKDSVFTHLISGLPARHEAHPRRPGRRRGVVCRSGQCAARRRNRGRLPLEATISRSFELMGFPENGAARMAVEAGVPILPLVIWGSQRVWTKGLPRRLGRTNVPIIMTGSRSRWRPTPTSTR